MKIFFGILLCFFTLNNSAFVYNIDRIQAAQQVKNKYVTIQISDLNNSLLPDLVEFLKSFEEKIVDVIYDNENRYLTIYYTSAIKLDDIFELLTQRTIDFVKISGTEL